MAVGSTSNPDGVRVVDLPGGGQAPSDNVPRPGSPALSDADIPGTLARDSEVSAAVATREPALGNPLVDGYLLSSTIVGVRSWVAPGVGGGGGGDSVLPWLNL